jgi:NitT/TauT family transport system permease protein
MAAARTAPPRSWTADALVAAALVAALYGVTRLDALAPGSYAASEITLAPRLLPYYTARSLLRMVEAYGLALLFTFLYGYPAAHNRKAARVMLPALDILQSIPVLSFMPSVVLALVALFPGSSLGPELASVVLIFTGQAWNMAFSFIHSLQSVPPDLREVAAMLQMNRWQRLRILEAPFAAVGLVWNSMISWAGGWFFLMASEMFSLGPNQYRLPGLGSYLQAAANAGDIRAVLRGVGTLVLVIALLDQLLWRPLVAWADKFKVELVQAGPPPHSAVLTVLRRSHLHRWLTIYLLGSVGELWGHLPRMRPLPAFAVRWAAVARHGLGLLLAATLVAVAAAGIWKGAGLLGALPLAVVSVLLKATGASALRVAAALAIGLAWTVPAGVAIGTNPKLSAVLQPISQILASIPATALFPVVLLVVLRLPGGLNLAAIGLLLLGTQWYLLFNIIAGASAMPDDLKEATSSMGLRGWLRWRTLVLPAIFPQLVTGMVTASGGAWNATIVSEYVRFQGEIHQTTGLGSLIAGATAATDFPLLLAATLTLAAVVVTVNRLVWQRLYQLAETRFTP